MKQVIYNALVLNDYPGGKHYASMVAAGVKTIETRMKTFKYIGDIVICCGNKSVSSNKGKALCIVHFGQGRPMDKGDEREACIESVPGRIAYQLTNRRLFSRTFEFSKRYVGGAYQSIFQITIPDDVKLLTP